MDKKLKLTTKKQWEKLFEFMHNNPDIARNKPKFGSSKVLVKEKCEQLAKELNSLGPPTRSSQEWQRVWINYKGNLKRKISNNRQNFLATGGGPSTEVSLNPMEENVLDLLHLDKQTNPVGKSFGVRKKSASKQSEESQDYDRENFPETFFLEDQGNMSEVDFMPKVLNSSRLNVSEAEDLMPNVSTRSRLKKVNKEDDRLECLKKHTKNQNEILQSLNRIESTIYKNYKVNKEILDIKQKKLRMEMEMHESRIALNKMKTKKLQKEIARMN